MVTVIGPKILIENKVVKGYKCQSCGGPDISEKINVGCEVL